MQKEIIKRAGFQLHGLGFEAVASNQLWFESTTSGRRVNLLRVGLWRPDDGDGWVFSIVFLWVKLMFGLCETTDGLR